MIDLRLGDCLAPDGLPALADGAVDFCCTDPPFDARSHRAALEGTSQNGKRWMGGNSATALPFEAFDATMIATVAHQLARVTRRWIVVFTAERQLETWAQALETSNARVVRFGIAQRTNPRPQLSGDRPAPAVDFLVIAHAKPGAMHWNGGGRAACWASPPARYDTEGENVHPCQKALALIKQLVADFSDPADLVLDPFAGSATCAVACHELGRRFLGWERDSDYYQTARARIEQAKRQLRLGEVRHKPEQADLFRGKAA